VRQAQSLRSAFRGWWQRSRQAASRTRHDTGAVMDGDLLQKLDRLTLQLGPDLISGLMGEHAARRRTSGIEFADYRQYSAGDDIRRVDWNAYARLGTLHVRQAQAEHDTVLYILVDGSPSMNFGEPTKFLAACRLAAALGYIALAHLDAVVMATPGALQDDRMRNAADGRPTTDDQQLATRNHQLATSFRGRAESGDMFRALQGLRTGSVADFDGLLAGWTAEGKRAGNTSSTGRIAMVISDLLLDSYRIGVKHLLSSGFQVSVLQLLSPEELVPPELGDLELVDSETNAHLDIYLGREGLTEYRKHLQAWLDECQTWCRSQGANYILLQSDWDTERILLDIFRRRGITS
jgi:uncharacterized protein (DUF58 family)